MIMNSLDFTNKLIAEYECRVDDIIATNGIGFMIAYVPEVFDFCKNAGISETGLLEIKRAQENWKNNAPVRSYRHNRIDREIKNALIQAEAQSGKQSFQIKIFKQLLIQLQERPFSSHFLSAEDDDYKTNVSILFAKHGITLEKLFPKEHKKQRKVSDIVKDKDNESKNQPPQAPSENPIADAVAQKNKNPYKNMVARFVDVPDNPLFGRESEIEILQHALLKKNKSNAILTGEAGVGKTAIVEGMAWMVAHAKCHPLLRGKEILSVNIGNLISGTTFRGDLERKIKKLLEYAESKNCILFIDEIHQLWLGRMSEENIMDMLKDKIAGSQVQIIGTTTNSEFGKLADSGFRRRFQEIQISEPSIDTTIRILKNLIPEYKKHYGIKIGESILSEIVFKAERLIHDKRFPDKAIDLFASACVVASSSKRSSLNIGHVNYILSQTLNIPTTMLEQGEKSKILTLKEDLSKVIFGQDSAIYEISETIAANYALRRDMVRPEAVMFFAGPSGVGKTETTEQLAKLLNRGFIRLNMNEFQTSHSISKLSGAEPGLVGYDNGGQLTNAVRGNPYAVILLDELAKTFLPEFLGRINKIVKFQSITPNALKMIMDKLSNDLIAFIAQSYGYTVTIDDSAKDAVIAEGASPTMGARRLKDTFFQMVECPLSKILLENGIGKNVIQITTEQNNLIKIITRQSEIQA